MTDVRVVIALTIAGSDSSGGAGIQADLKTFGAFGVYGASAITAVTAQNTLGVLAVHAVPSEIVSAQIASVASDLSIAAAKTGMLGGRDTVLAVGEAVRRHNLRPLVVDPVMVATSGDMLIEEGAVEALRDELIPLAAVLTPNLAEAARLLGAAEAESESEQCEQAQQLLGLGAQAVVLKGGHGRGPEAVDILATQSGIIRLARPRVATRNTHGTGCTLSAAIAACLARGETVEEAVRLAKDFVTAALASGADLSIGSGHGPVDPLGIKRTS